MPSANDILAIAAKEIGYEESPANSNTTKYGAWYGNNGVAWCAMFVSWVFNQANALSLIGGKEDYTVAMAEWFYRVGQWGKTPKVGAVVFFHFGNPTYGGRWLGIHHVGIVKSVNTDGTIFTIEGNTSLSSDDNGGAVMQRTRKLSSVAGFGYPQYSVPFESFYWLLVPCETIPQCGAVKRFGEGLGVTTKQIPNARSVLMHVRHTNIPGKRNTYQWAVDWLKGRQIPEVYRLAAGGPKWERVV